MKKRRIFIVILCILISIALIFLISIAVLAKGIDYGADEILFDASKSTSITKLYYDANRENTLDGGAYDPQLFEEICGANEKGQRTFTTHIWQEFLDLVEQLRKTERGKEIYAMRKETIERVFADAKEKHAMRYTHHRGLARVSAWVRLKYAAMNLKKLAKWRWSKPDFLHIIEHFLAIYAKTPVLAS